MWMIFLWTNQEIYVWFEDSKLYVCVILFFCWKLSRHGTGWIFSLLWPWNYLMQEKCWKPISTQLLCGEPHTHKIGTGWKWNKVDCARWIGFQGFNDSYKMCLPCLISGICQAREEASKYVIKWELWCYIINHHIMRWQKPVWESEL